MSLSYGQKSLLPEHCDITVKLNFGYKLLLCSFVFHPVRYLWEQECYRILYHKVRHKHKCTTTLFSSPSFLCLSYYAIWSKESLESKQPNPPKASDQTEGLIEQKPVANTEEQTCHLRISLGKWPESVSMRLHWTSLCSIRESESQTEVSGAGGFRCSL